VLRNGYVAKRVLAKTLSATARISATQCCSAVKTSREIKDLPATAYRFAKVHLSNGKFSLDGLEMNARLTTLQFPDARQASASVAVFAAPTHEVSAAPAATAAGTLTVVVAMERTMLSPHEFATLMLVKDAPTQVDMNREELDALLEHQLVQLENLASGRQQWRITEYGDSALKAIKRFS
jgi:hypothetical protein